MYRSPLHHGQRRLLLVASQPRSPRHDRRRLPNPHRLHRVRCHFG